MNKKVKWSGISVTTASLLTFAGLIAGNTEKVADNNTVAANSDESVQDNFSDIPDSNESNESNGLGTDHGEHFFHEHGQRGDQGEYSQDSESSQDQFNQDSESSQDQFFQAPSGGFEQGAGSSGSSH
ncbi:hypothetical protein R4Z09_01070 [Niallia oryzisoli]|uniref:Uncharacterized protein n=1 Tax=Niallia oryzisoli TaxID=1737571 RepID=A0ABZ2CF46_9BACI